MPVKSPWVAFHMHAANKEHSPWRGFAIIKPEAFWRRVSPVLFRHCGNSFSY